MASRTLIHEEALRGPVRRARGKGLAGLGWAHYWLLTAFLSGLLGLITMTLLLGGARG